MDSSHSQWLYIFRIWIKQVKLGSHCALTQMICSSLLPVDKKKTFHNQTTLFEYDLHPHGFAKEYLKCFRINARSKVDSDTWVLLETRHCWSCWSCLPSNSNPQVCFFSPRFFFFWPAVVMWMKGPGISHTAFLQQGVCARILGLPMTRALAHWIHFWNTTLCSRAPNSCSYSDPRSQEHYKLPRELQNYA